MRIKDIKKINDNTYFYKEKANSFYISFYFTYEINRKNILINRILFKYLTTTNSVYKEQKEIIDREDYLYGLGFNAHSSTYANTNLFSLNARMIDYNILNDNCFDEQIEFIKTMIFKPNFVNGKLDESKLKLIKEEIFNDYINSINDLNFDTFNKYIKTTQPNSKECLYRYDSNEELQALLDDITDEDIISFYNTVLDNHFVTMIYGNLNNKEVNKIINEFKFKKSNIKRIKEADYQVLKNEYNEYVSKYYDQSKLYFSYNAKDVKYSNIIMSRVLDIMSNSLDGPLLSILRTKYGIVYHAYCAYDYEYNVFKIVANIDKKNKETTIKGIREYIDLMKDKKFVKQRLEYAKDKIRQDIKVREDEIYTKLAVLSDYSLSILTSKNEYYRYLNKLTVDDIIDFFNNLENENIFYYVGDKDE